jgi:hypothetical protein
VLAAYVFAIVANLVHPAAQPELHVEPSCRAVTNLHLPGGQSFTQCMQDELEARQELAKKWTSYSAPARSRCAAEVMIGGGPSYVELLECLEMDKTVSQERSHNSDR